MILEELKTTYEPHIQQAMERIESVVTHLHHKSETGDLQRKFKNWAEKIKPHVQAIDSIVFEDAPLVFLPFE